MLDMHNHVLFGVDDGCQTIEESITMIQAAVDAGVTDLILTPHYGPKRHYMATHEEIQTNLKQLKETVQQLALPINLYLGREIDEIDNIVELLNNKTLETMNDTTYVLIDFGMAKCDIDEYCYNLIINGYKPIIAHVERYNYLEDFTLFQKYKRTGALIQVNASSILHPKTKQIKKKVQYLLKNGLIDLVASDAHRNPKSYSDLKQTIELIHKKHKNNPINKITF
jgi:protein-tyrosine phosphatase